MGYSRSTADDWASYSRTTSAKPASAIFTTTSAAAVKDDLLPKNITMRESRDSAANPNSNAIILASDVTGSMGMLAETLIRKGLGLAFTEILERAKPDPKTGRVMMVTDPHMMCMAVGDAWYDETPLQITQFEADLKIAKQLEEVFIERGGGPNDHESYHLPWYFAAMKTSIDCFEKRKRKGYLFTVGDEPPPPVLLADHVKKVFGDTLQADLTTLDVLGLAQRTYHVFHIIIAEGDGVRMRGLERVQDPWRNLLGQNALVLRDHSKLAELVVSTIQVNEGCDVDSVAKSWSGSTGIVVADALGGLGKMMAKTGYAAGSGLRRF